MAIDTTFYRDLAYVFGAAVAGGAVAKALRQPLILGYVLGGVLIGPFTPGPSVSGIKEFELLAEMGVILLMYSIGLEFSFRDLLEVKWVAIVGGPLGILLSVGLALLVGWLLGWSPTQSIAVGAIVSVASTMVLSRLLADRGELRSPHGRIMIGITLVEDLAVVALTVLLPSLKNISGGHLFTLGIGLGKAFLILTPVMLVAAKLIPPLMKRVARVDPRIFISKLSLWGTIVLLTVVGKFTIWTTVVRLFHYPTRTAFLVGIGLTQIGEFSYVLVRVARDAQLLGDDFYHATLAASVVTLVLNGLLFRTMPKNIQRPQSRA